MAFISTFIMYVIIMLFLAGVAVLGIFAGKKLRNRKNEKDAALKAAEENAGANAEVNEKE
ncbi:MAG: hypothetical protein ACK5ML_09635 [Lachnospiraceae bacterium]